MLTAKRVLIASHVRQKPSILKEFLEGLKSLETKDLKVDFAFVDDNSEDKSSFLLEDFAAQNSIKTLIKAKHQDSYATSQVLGFKNRLLLLAKQQRYDFVFFVDADLFLHPKTLVHLITLNKDIVSEVFWRVWTKGIPAKPRLYKVGGLGPCTLMSNKALCEWVSFNSVCNLSLEGDCRSFCNRAVLLGLEVYADTHYPPFHIYQESELIKLEQYKSSCFKLNK